MKFILTVLGLWHGWRAAVWRARRVNPRLSEDASIAAWQRWDVACSVMEKYHERRHDEIGRHLLSLCLRYIDPKDLP